MPAGPGFVAELDAQAPPRAGSAGGALYALLNGLKVALDARGMVIQELFEPIEPTVPRPTGPLRDRIRQAYRNLASRPWDWVELRDLRAQLGDCPRREVDLEITRMFREKDVNLTLHEDRGRLTQADRDAALRARRGRHALGQHGVSVVGSEQEAFGLICVPFGVFPQRHLSATTSSTSPAFIRWRLAGKWTRSPGCATECRSAT